MTWCETTTGKLYWLASYPKSGNTWVRVFIANLLSDRSAPVNINALDVGGVASSYQWLEAVLDFDISELSQDEIAQMRPVAYRLYSQHLAALEYRKIHDAYLALPDGTSMVPPSVSAGALYIIRNPLDVAVSFAHHRACSVDEAISYMADPQYALCDDPARFYQQLRQRLLSWSGHVLSWTEAKDLRCSVVRYEDMKLNPLPTFSAIAEAILLPQDEECIAKALKHSCIQVLQAQEAQSPFRERNPCAKTFFRRGEVGDWRQVLSKRQIDTLLKDHGDVMYRFAYLDANGNPSHQIMPQEMAQPC